MTLKTGVNYPRENLKVNCAYDPITTVYTLKGEQKNHTKNCM